MDGESLARLNLLLTFGLPLSALMFAYLVGGRVKTYEPLLDRARREASLRMIEQARELGCDAVFNVRLETSRLANSTGEGNRTAGVEMLAFGTAVKLRSRFGPRRS